MSAFAKKRLPRWETLKPLRTYTGTAKEIVVRSRKFDLIYKIRLAKAWASGAREEIRRAETDYLEMQRARLSFFEDEPLRTCPADFIAAFRKTAGSILSEGYDFSAPPIPVEEATGELLNGAHRLASCAAFDRPIPVATYPQVYFGTHGGSTFRAFRAGRIAPSVENRGIRAYLDFNDRARLAHVVAAAGEGEEAAIARVERTTGALVWHARPAADGYDVVLSFPAGVPADLPSRTETFAEAARRYPEMPDPDWRARADEIAPDAFRCWLRTLKYRLTLPLRHGRRRRKAELHILDWRCRATAARALADYLETQVPSKGLPET